MPVKRLITDLLVGLILAMLLLSIFIWMGTLVLEDGFSSFDHQIQAFIEPLHSPLMTTLFSWITYIGNSKTTVVVFIVVSLFLIFNWNHFWESTLLFITLLGGWFLNFWLKNLYGRSRPEVEHLVEAGGLSFPSGHAMVSLSFYGMLAYLVYINKNSTLAIIFFSLLIFLIGFSRIYLGVHFPSDVIAGFCAGAVWLIACILGLRTIRFYKSN